MDKRRCARYRLDLPVTYMWREASGECVQAAGFIRDISARGMLVLGGECPPPQSQVWCEVMLPPSYSRDSIRRLRAAGPVVRTANSPGDECSSGFVIQGSPFLLTEEADKAEWVRLISDQQRARTSGQYNAVAHEGDTP
ncbi:MAG TPA: PilZ domain-containing protein [Terriglobales bacterium]|nr:PilZ domain-containing protein [Terriglobales bacterium]